MDILIIAVTLVVVAVPEGMWSIFICTNYCSQGLDEGLPLAVTLALAFATKRMTKENLLVRVLASCETMANASVVCTDKTGTLTQNAMTVVAGSIGVSHTFVRQLDQNPDRRGDTPADRCLDQSQLNSVASPQLRHLFNEAIALNSTAFEDKNPDGSGGTVFVGNKTESALLVFARDLNWGDYMVIRERSADRVVQMVPFSSERKAMGMVIRLDTGVHRFYIKGASEVLSKACSSHVVVGPSATADGNNVLTAPMDDAKLNTVNNTITFYASQTFRTIALCYRDFDVWPPVGVPLDEEQQVCILQVIVHHCLTI